MFRTRVFGGTPDAFHLACEYGPQHVPRQRGSSQLPSPAALARLELDWTSAESEAQVLERFAQRQSALLLEQAEEAVTLELSCEAMPHAASFPEPRVSVALRVTSRPPVLRSLHFSHTSGSGTVPEPLLANLLRHMDLSHVWKVRGCEGLPAHFWATCTEPACWGSLFNLNLSSCGLSSLPGAVGELATLHVLRLNHNRLTSLPPELGQLNELEVLSVNHNQLTTLPAELRRCSALREVHLEHNRLVTPLLDLTHATALESLQLYGNPLEYLPELAPAVGLRSLSLANVRVLADATYTRWDVEVTPPSSSYTSMVMGRGGHKLQPLFNLVFRRSSVQHPLLAGALSRLVEDASNLELLVREDVALQQLVLAAMGPNPLVVQQAVNVLATAGAHAGAARRLVKHNAVRAILGMLAAPDVALQLCGLRVLSSLAAGAAEGEVPGEVLVPTQLLDRLLALIKNPATDEQVRCAALHALGNSAFDATNRRRYLQSPGLMQLLVLLAATPDAQSPEPADPASSRSCSASPASTQPDAPASSVSPPAPERRGTTAGGAAAPGASSPLQLAPAAAHTSSEQQGAPEPAGQAPLADGSSEAAAAGAAGAAAPEQGASQGGAISAAAASAVAAVSPPTLTMQRNASICGTAGAEPAAVVAEAAAGGAAGLAVAAGTSDAGAGINPERALVAAAGAAAVTAAAAPGGGVAGAPTPAATAATAAMPLPKRRGKLVAVRSPLKLQAIRLLAILGQNEQVRIALGQPPIRGRGLRVLAMDGGGMKGLALVELLRQLERRAGAPLWSLFDVIGGTSTGGLLAVGLGILRLDLDACADIYTNLGNKVFNQSTAVQEEAGWRESLYRMYAASSANMRVWVLYGSKHDAAPYEALLRQFCAVSELGCPSDRLIDTAVLGGPKVFVCSTLASCKPAAPFAFRNYELPDEAAPAAAQLAACGGSCKHHVWEAVRASSAAPYYLEDFITPDGKRFQDGATTANNPAVIALQQARLLHPQLPVDCLVSLGCGTEPPSERCKGSHWMMDTGSVLLESACSVDRVHEALASTLQLVPGCQYFRFSPVDARCAMELDDIRPESWTKLVAATSEYCSQPDVAAQFDRLAALLTAPRGARHGDGAADAAGPAGGALRPGGGSGSYAGRVARVLGQDQQRQPLWQQQQQQPHAKQARSPLHTAVLKAAMPAHAGAAGGVAAGSGGAWGGLASPRPRPGQAARAGRALAEPASPQQQGQHRLTDQGLAADGECSDGAGSEAALAAPPATPAAAAAARKQMMSPAPRLLTQRGLLLVQAPRDVAAAAAAAAAARGVPLSALQQQECVAQLLAASLPQELLHLCDLAAASAAAAAAALPAVPGAAGAAPGTGLGLSPGGWQRHGQGRSSKAGTPSSADASPIHAHHGRGGAGSRPDGGAVGQPAGSQLQQAHAPPLQQPESRGPSDSGGAKAQQQRRLTADGSPAASSPTASSWFEYIFPWPGAAHHHHQQQQPGPGATPVPAGQRPGAAGAGAAGRPPSPGRSASPDTQKRAAAGASLPLVRSSPDLVPQQQHAPDGSPGSLGRIRSLPSQYQQQQQQQPGCSSSPGSAGAAPPWPGGAFGSGGGASSGRNARPQSHLSLSAGGAGAAEAVWDSAPAAAGLPSLADIACAEGSAAGSSLSQQQLGGAAVCEALRGALGAAAGHIGVLHLALHATEKSLVAGWRQQLAAVVEPGAGAAELLTLLGAEPGASLGELVAAQGPLLPGPDGALVAVLAQQQVLAPVPLAAAAGGLAPGADAAAACGGLGLPPAQQFVTSWLLQLTLPDAARSLGVGQLWPLLSQLQQLIVVASGWLPRELVHVLLRGGVAAVVCGCHPDAVAAQDAAELARFFAAFYEDGLWAGLDVVEALAAAAAAAPSVGDAVYECFQLS